MKKNLSLMFAAIVAGILLFSCQKDDVSSTAGNGGTAVFKIAGLSSGAPSITVAGVYTSGASLGSSNTVTIEVEVLAAGTYSFRTTSANGVYFSGSGSFSSTGVQTVVLTGVGTPIRGGSFVFVTTNNSPCNFTINFTQGTSGGGGGGGGTLATFTYAGAPGSCTSPVINGTYRNGIALNTTNTVDLSVNVTTIGAYSISTNTASGISFIGTGVFTTTGAQTVRLTGQGTPTASGAATFTPTGGCGFSVTIIAPPPPGAFTYNCGTTPVVNGTYTAGTALNANNTIVIAVNVTTAGSYSVTTPAANGVTFSGSGVFAATGATTITLTSTNTPTAAGNFNYTPSGTGGCAFSVTYGTGGGGGGGGNYFRCKMDGVLKTYQDRLMADPTPLNGINRFAISGYLAPIPSDDYLDITVNGLNPITVGTYPHGFGIVFSSSYNRDNGFGWQPSSNSNPSFSVVVTALTANRITGTFSGQYIDLNGTGTVTKQITEGAFSVSY